MKRSGSRRTPSNLDRSSSRGCFSTSTQSPAPSGTLPSDGSWRSKGVLQAQQVSSSKEIVVLEEITGNVKSQFASNVPLCTADRELQEAFLRFDTNRDGKISTVELGSVLRSLGDNPSDQELFLMVKEVDRDGDGYIDLQEFILLNRTCSTSGKEDLHQAFLVFDADADGKISAEELHCVLGRLGESSTLEECSRMIQGVDLDGDGFVDFQEFCTMMNMQSWG